MAFYSEKTPQLDLDTYLLIDPADRHFTLVFPIELTSDYKSYHLTTISEGGSRTPRGTLTCRGHENIIPLLTLPILVAPQYGTHPDFRMIPIITPNILWEPDNRTLSLAFVAVHERSSERVGVPADCLLHNTVLCKGGNQVMDLSGRASVVDYQMEQKMYTWPSYFFGDFISAPPTRRATSKAAVVTLINLTRLSNKAVILNTLGQSRLSKSEIEEMAHRHGRYSRQEVREFVSENFSAFYHSYFD